MADLRLRISELMTLFNVTEIDVVRSTKVGQATLNNLRKGVSVDPKLSTLKPLAEYFNITLGQLVGDEPLPANLSAQTIVEKRGFLEIPLLSWDQISKYKEIVQNLNHSNWSEWIYTDEPIVSPYAFALEIAYQGLEPTFPQFSRIIVEPETKPQSGNFIICKANNKSFMLAKLITNGAENSIFPVNSNMHIFSNEITEILGTILGIQSTFKTKVIPDTDI